MVKTPRSRTNPGIRDRHLGSQAVYVEALGLEIERDSPMFIQFNNFAIASDKSMSGNRDPEVYWVVEDVEAAFKDLSQKAARTSWATQNGRDCFA